MSRYKIWDKQEDILTIVADHNGKSRWTAQEYMNTHAVWATLPNSKVIVGGGIINGTVFQEFYQTVDHYVAMGLELKEGMSDQEILDAIEYFEDHPPEAPPCAEERIAAALEFLCITEMINLNGGIE